MTNKSKRWHQIKTEENTMHNVMFSHKPMACENHDSVMSD